MTTLPTGNEEQRARWDLLLLDIEQRSNTPSRCGR